MLDNRMLGVMLGVESRRQKTTVNSILDCWIEWKQHCALGLCSDNSKNVLRKFAVSRFHRFIREYANRTNVTDIRALSCDAVNIWHLFETHLMIKNTKAGKRYKDWLFARLDVSSDDKLDVLQGGATLIMRDVAREYLRREFSPNNMVSLNTPLAGNEDVPLTLEDLLPGKIDPAYEVEIREFEKLAKEQADRHFEDLIHREKVALLAKEIGISLAHPAVTRCARCKKSVLSSLYRDFIARVSARIEADYPDDDKESVLMMTLMSVNEIRKAVLLWGKSEKSCAHLFLLL